MTKLTIKVTKDRLQESKYCGFEIKKMFIPGNCAISEAIRDIFPKALVFGGGRIDFFGNDLLEEQVIAPIKAQEFMSKFDRSSPEERLLMPGIEFDIEIPDTIIEKINIDEIKPLLVNHPCLKLEMV